MRYLSIKDAAALTGKSESSVKRFVNQVKIKEPAKYRDPARFKFEKLPNGNDKILISEVYLLARFTSSKNELHDLVDDLVNSPESLDKTNGSHSSGTRSKNELHDLVDSSENLDNTNSSHGSGTRSNNDPHDLVEFLKAQLVEKDKQIEALLDRNKEINLLFAQAQQRQQIQIEESMPKKRWWQRK